MKSWHFYGGLKLFSIQGRIAKQLNGYEVPIEKSLISLLKANLVTLLGTKFLESLDSTHKCNRTDEGFVVYQGSQAVLEHRKSATTTRRNRDLLIAKEILVNDGNHYVFSRDYEFTSPSRAASAVRGGNSNGLTLWKTIAGKTLKELEGG